MSAISFPSTVDLEIPVRQRGSVATVPAAYPYPQPAAVAKRSTQARATNLLASVLLNVMFMSVIAGATFVASGFAGNVQLESANRETLQSMDRASAANVAESGLRREVDALVSDDSVARWASFNKFKAPYNLTPDVKKPVAK
jgi:hypothetical protein